MNLSTKTKKNSKILWKADDKDTELQYTFFKNKLQYLIEWVVNLTLNDIKKLDSSQVTRPNLSFEKIVYYTVADSKQISNSWHPARHDNFPSLLK